MCVSCRQLIAFVSIYTILIFLLKYLNYEMAVEIIFFVRDPIYFQYVIIHSANGGKGEGWHVEECSVALLCK
jgi:hypothetical protein